jgi:uridine kinase
VKIIGISGVSGSGKSRLTQAIKEHFGDDMIVIHQDDFYCDQSHLPFSEREKTNYDEPQSIDFSCLEKTVKNLSEGNEIEIPQYNFAEHTRFEQKKRISPKTFVLVEGTMIFSQKSITDLLDLSFYVDTPLDIAIVRRMTRDIKERERTADSIQDQYFSTVRQGMIDFCISYKNKANHSVSGEKDVLDYKKTVIDLINS